MATYVNNHIHTTYSFSPYTPAAAVEAAMKSGLKTAGIIDHDSVGGAKEFIEAGQRLGMPVTVGVECRVDMSATPLNGKRLNNPDQKSVAYVTMHGIPHQNIDKVDAFFAPYREKRNQRNRIMCQNISTLTAPYHITLDFDRDVLPLATATVTERHILFALVKKIVAIYDTPEKVVDFICNTMDISLSEKVKAQILAELVEKLWPKVATGEVKPTIYKVLPITDRAHEYGKELAQKLIERISKYTDYNVNIMDENGIIKNGVIIRHLVLPNHTKNSIGVLDIIKDNFDDKTLISLMGQYIPYGKAFEHEDINRKITKREYNKVLDKLLELDLDGFSQELESADKSYIPQWDY